MVFLREKQNFFACNHNNNNVVRQQNHDMANEVSKKVVSKKEVMHIKKNN